MTSGYISRFDECISICSKDRVGSGVDGFGEPRADVCLAAGAYGLREVDRQPCSYRYKRCRCIPNDASVGGLPAQSDILHKLLRFGGGIKHSVSDAKELWAHAEKCGSNAIKRVGIIRALVLHLPYSTGKLIRPDRMSSISIELK